MPTRYLSTCVVLSKLIYRAISRAHLVKMSEGANPSCSSRPDTPSLRRLHFKDDASETTHSLQMSFGGCGFLGVYHVGVGKCVVDHAPHLFSEFDGFYGASAGAITAVCAACRSDPMIPYKWVRKTFEDSRKYWFGMFNPFFDLYGRLRIFLNSYLPGNAHKLCRGVVKISLTVIGENGLPTNWLVSDFKTRDELINIIIASSFIPGYAGFKDLPKIRGKRCCDGGFTSNIPFVSDPDVISVSPFAGFCDICPQNESCTQHMINICDQPMQLSPANLYRLAKSLCPTSWQELEDLYHQGYSDCLAFFRREGLIPDPKIEKRKDSSLPSPTSDDESVPLTTRSCDLPGNSKGKGHSRITSLTLSSSGEFLSCFGASERDSVSSIALEEVERGLDLKGTEKATHLMRHYGREKSHHELNQWFTDDKMRVILEEENVGLILRLMYQPVRILRLSYKGFSRQRPLSLLPEYERDHQGGYYDDLCAQEGFLGSLVSSSMLIF